jgi:class 3 adenylate cyclase/tetratricopeptide (TPR) repeat protein
MVDAELDKVRNAIAALEAQRALLGDAVVDTALAGLRQQLAALEDAQAVGAFDSTPSEERRIITILFADIVGSTSLAEQLDPEEWRQSVAAFHAAAGGAVEAHGGQVAQYLGDGLLAFFGAEAASEHDPENAIRAALDLQAAVAELPPLGAHDATTDGVGVDGVGAFDRTPPGRTPPATTPPARLQARAGLHTGPVVLGELGSEGHKELTATGDAMNLAARLQGAAPPGGVLISHEAYRHVRGVFDVTPRPPLSLKGKREPVKTYLVRRAKPRAFRSAAARGVVGIETRTVGREAELEQLQQIYEQTLAAGTAAWAQLVGEPGIGKSRLLEDMREWLDLRPQLVLVLRGRAFSDDAGQPYALIRRMWFDRFLIADDTPLAAAELRWVKGFQELSGRDDPEPAYALGRLIGLPFADALPAGAAPPGPDAVRGRAYVVSRELLRAMRARGPVVMLLEDLHWADAASWNWLEQVVVSGHWEAGSANPQPAPGDWQAGGDVREGGADGRQATGLFVLGSARPTWSPPWREAGPPDGRGLRYLQLDVQPLAEAAREELVRELFSRVEGVPDDVVAAVVERSEGVPYFAEELINWFVDRGLIDRSSEPWHFAAKRLPEAPLPATLQHLLFTRLTGLAPAERAALQRGAIFGRNFWTGGVEALGAPGGQVLKELQPRGFVHAQPESAFEGETEWSFHHALLREVTYESVLRRERQALHKAAADWLEAQAARAGRTDEFAGLLAEHAERAGEHLAAAGWYLRAGARSLAQGAAREAVQLYTKALDLTPPVELERRWQALSGREEANAVLTDPARQVDLDELLGLAQELDDADRLADVYLRRADFMRQTREGLGPIEAATAALEAARQAGNRALEARALALRGQARIGIGSTDELLADADAALALARDLGDDLTLARVLHSAAACYSQSLHFERGIACQREQIEISRRLGDRPAEAGGLVNLGVAYDFLGLYREARAALEAALAVAESLGMHRMAGYAANNLADLIHDTHGDLGLARRLAEFALGEMTAANAAMGRAFALAVLGQIEMAMGNAAGALRLASQADDIVAAIGHPQGMAYSQVMLARYRLELGNLDEARTLGDQAWELLEAWLSQGGRAEAVMFVELAEVFDALEDAERMQAVVRAGMLLIMAAADGLKDPDWRRAFLQDNVYNRRLVQWWEKLP